MESWDHRDGEVWVDCEAAQAAFESAKAEYGKQVQQALDKNNLGPGHISRIRGRADGERQRYARVQKGTLNNFAAACHADANKIMVSKATVREWQKANPPDEAKPGPEINRGGAPDGSSGDEPVSSNNPDGGLAPDRNSVGEPAPDSTLEVEPVAEKNQGEPMPDKDTGVQPASEHGFREPLPDKNFGNSERANKSSRLNIAAAAAVAILVIAALAVGAWKLIPGQSSLAISQLRMFDDSHRKGQPGHRTLTALRKKKAAFYEITTTDEFLMSLGFVISGYTKKPDGSINLEAVVTGKGANSDAWHVDYKFTRPDEWRRMDVTESVGAPAVVSEFNLRDESAFPLIALIECAEVDELVRWTGRVEVKVIDHNDGDKEANDRITINLNRTSNLTPPSKCTQKP